MASKFLLFADNVKILREVASDTQQPALGGSDKDWIRVYQKCCAAERQ